MKYQVTNPPTSLRSATSPRKGRFFCKPSLERRGTTKWWMSVAMIVYITIIACFLFYLYFTMLRIYPHPSFASQNPPSPEGRLKREKTSQRMSFLLLWGECSGLKVSPKYILALSVGRCPDRRASSALRPKNSPPESFCLSYNFTLENAKHSREVRR